MLIHIENTQQDLILDPVQIEKIVRAILERDKVKCDELSLFFVDTESISSLHKDYFDDPSTTDCITFPMDDESNIDGFRYLGDLFICPATAVDYAKTHQIDPYEETTLYIVHGLLHLQGFRDLEEEEILSMRKAEKERMLFLKELKLLLSSL